jgi:hypothetical protein
MLVHVPKLTNYLILSHRVGRFLPWSVCFLMFGAELLIPLVERNIM